MAITVTESEDGKKITIKLPGEFDFRAHREFRNTHKGADPTAEYILDFSLTQHIDSSALGMLLLMREELGEDSAKVKIINCRPNIKKLLEMANFHQLFSVA
ncbi:MAG: STAS domain-containing protein [Thioalkalispiraceae bacterium]